MEFRGAFQVLRRGEISAPPKGLRPLLGRESSLDVRKFPCPTPAPAGPRLLVSAPRRAGSAVQRNRFRRRVRMAFLRLLRDEARALDPGLVVWVRPAKGCDLPFDDVLSLLRRAILS